MKRWTHLHSIGTGGLIFMLASGHLLWLLTLTLAAGIALGRGWLELACVAHWLSHRWGNRSRLQDLRPKPVYRRVPAGDPFEGIDS